MTTEETAVERACAWLELVDGSIERHHGWLADELARQAGTDRQESAVLASLYAGYWPAWVVAMVDPETDWSLLPTGPIGPREVAFYASFILY